MRFGRTWNGADPSKWPPTSRERDPPGCYAAHRKPSPSVAKRKPSERKDRIGQIIQWLSGGMAAHVIVQQAGKQWGATEYTTRKLIKAARKTIGTYYDCGDLAVQLPAAIALAETHYQTLMDAEAWGPATSALKWIGELRGLTAQQRISNETDKLRAQLDALRGARGGRPEPTEQERLDAYNAARATYNLTPWTMEEWIAYARASDVREGDRPTEADAN